MTTKSTVEEIRERFDRDVERFSNLETGQTATMDAPLMLDLVADAAQRTTPHARALLDIGCGAGNYALKLLQALPGMSVTLVDLSRPMLDRAVARVAAATDARVDAKQGDIRHLDLGHEAFDVITAAATLHHLRTDDEWEQVFGACYQALRPGGSFWIVDLVSHDSAALQALMWSRYGDYLAGVGGSAYRDRVFAYVEQEDSPRSVTYQVDLLRRTGFDEVDVLHKHACFAAFGGVKTAEKCGAAGKE
jgi:tRNA (cmo5U34)-methyltransferase